MTRSTLHSAVPRDTAASTISSQANFINSGISVVAASMNALTARFVASLHETRHRQAMDAIRLYQQICGDDKDTN